MSVVDLAIEKVKRLNESRARQLLVWLQAHEQPVPALAVPLGARAMLGYARRLRPEARATADWLSELREGERD